MEAGRGGDSSICPVGNQSPNLSERKSEGGTPDEEALRFALQIPERKAECTPWQTSRVRRQARQPGERVVPEIHQEEEILLERLIPPPSAGLSEGIGEFFAERGILSRTLPRYEFRPQQLEMALAVGAAIEKGEILLVEAGTGVGKSLSYLVPLLLYAIREEKRAFVATGTKTLQHQLIEKELPFLKRHLPGDFTYALCLGAENYLCERRLADLNPANPTDLFGNANEVAEIKEWSQTCRLGLRSEIDFTVSPQTWFQVCRVAELCAGQNCPQGGECHYQQARRRMNRAEILVGNHHLLFANLRAEWEYLPACQILLIDEAHNLDEVASDCLGIEFSLRAMRRVWEGLRGKDGAGCLIGALHDLRPETRQKMLDEVREAERRYAEAIHWFHEHFLQDRPRSVLSADNATVAIEHFLEPLETVVSSLRLAAQRVDNEERANECLGYAVRLDRAVEEARFVLGLPSDAPWLFWCEEISTRSKSLLEPTRTALFHATPLEPGEILNERLYGAFEASILVSATLSVSGDFSYSRRRLGTWGDRSGEVSLPSPFNTKEHLLVYVPSHLSPPERFEEYVSDLTDQIVELVKATPGGSFVLCTSFQLLDQLYDRFRDRVPSRGFRRPGRKSKAESLTNRILVLRQGEASREVLLESFREEGRAVLFGAATFWQGVDVPGEALQLVIITRLPFQVPDDPVLEARVQRCRARGGNPFYEMQIPHAVVQFRQGLGRLIRSHTDRGVVALLDSRVATKQYGHLFLEALPECQVTEELETTKAFLRSVSTST